MTGSVLGLKRKRKLKKFQSQSKCRKIKDIFTEDKKTGKRIINGVFKIGSRYLSQAQHANIYLNSHTVKYKPIAPADNSAQLEFNCSGHSDYYIDLKAVRLLLRFKLVKTDGSDMASDEANTVGCVNNLLHSMFSSLSVSLNGKPVTLHESNYH